MNSQPRKKNNHEDVGLCRFSVHKQFGQERIHRHCECKCKYNSHSEFKIY